MTSIRISDIVSAGPDHVIGAEHAVLPLCAQAYFSDLRSPLRSRSATSRSAQSISRSDGLLYRSAS